MAERCNEVVVTGLGVVSPIGIGKQAFWSALCAGESGIRGHETIARELCAVVTGFAARDFVRSPHLRRADDLSRMITAAARMAVDDAGLDLPGREPEHSGVVVGSALGAVRDSVQYLEKFFAKGPALASPMMFPNLVLNAAASYVAMELGATGTNFTVGEGEVSGEQALALACDVIRSGRAEVVVAGGGDDFCAEIVAGTYRHLGAMAGQSGGEIWCSPYDRDRSGIVVGQGAAMLVLESPTHAQQRGARTYASITDYWRTSLPAPPFDWPSDIVSLALPSNFAQIDLMIGNANSSRRLDACELDVAERLRGEGRDLWVTSIKGAIGELGAAGALSAVAACLAVREGVVPPLCHLRHADTSAALRFAAGRAVSAPIRRALSLGMARGGSLIALLFESAQGGV